MDETRRDNRHCRSDADLRSRSDSDQRVSIQLTECHCETDERSWFGSRNDYDRSCTQAWSGCARTIPFGDGIPCFRFLMALSPPLPSSFIDHRPNLGLHVLDPGLSFSPITFDYDGAQDLPTPAPRSWKDEPSSTLLVRRTYPFHSSVISNVTFWTDLSSLRPQHDAASVFLHVAVYKLSSCSWGTCMCTRRT